MHGGLDYLATYQARAVVSRHIRELFESIDWRSKSCLYPDALRPPALYIIAFLVSSTTTVLATPPTHSLAPSLFCTAIMSTAATSEIPITDPNYKPQPGRLGNLSAQQQEALDRFRAEIQQEGWFVPERMSDAMLLRCAHPPLGAPAAALVCTLAAPTALISDITRPCQVSAGPEI